jgi:hypothetical protein
LGLFLKINAFINILWAKDISDIFVYESSRRVKISFSDSVGLTKLT